MGDEIKFADDTIEGVLYLLYQEDTLPSKVMVKVSTLQRAVHAIVEARKMLENGELISGVLQISEITAIEWLKKHGGH